MRPERIWHLSTRLYSKGWKLPAKALKTLNYVLFKTVLPYEVKLGRDVNLWHRGLAVVIHPNVVIGNNVGIGHGVTIQGTAVGRMIVEDNVRIGAGAIILTRSSKPVRIGAGAVIGAGSVVVGDVEPGAVVAGNPARPMK